MIDSALAVRGTGHECAMLQATPGLDARLAVDAPPHMRLCGQGAYRRLTPPYWCRVGLNRGSACRVVTAVVQPYISCSIGDFGAGCWAVPGTRTGVGSGGSFSVACMCTHPGDTHPGDTHPGDTHPRDTHPGDTHPGDTHPGDTHPGDTHPGDTHPRDTHPGDTHPGDTHPGDTHPGDIHPGVRSRAPSFRDLHGSPSRV